MYQPSISNVVLSMGKHIYYPVTPKKNFSKYFEISNTPTSYINRPCQGLPLAITHLFGHHVNFLFRFSHHFSALHLQIT